MDYVTNKYCSDGIELRRKFTAIMVSCQAPDKGIKEQKRGHNLESLSVDMWSFYLSTSLKSLEKLHEISLIEKERRDRHLKNRKNKKNID